ncbi:MAG: helix-turn-helix domain-containing protein [Vicinamibacteria bacterium]
MIVQPVSLAAPARFEHDTPLGRFSYAEWRPAHLAPLVDLFWYAQGRSTFPRKRLFPNGRIELLVNLGDPIRLVEGVGSPVLKSGWLSGLHARPVVIESTYTTDCLGVRLKPAGAHALLARPLSEISGWTLDLSDLFGRAAAELAERCADARSVEDRFRRAAAWIEARAAPGSQAPAVDWTVAHIERSAGSLPIAALRARTGLSKTRLADGFRERIGLSPKVYARIFRFQRLLNLLHDGPATLADAALETGYYDQPHMTADFRELTGMTPRAFVAAARYTHTLSVAEGPPAS